MPKGVYNVVHGFGPGSAGEFLTATRASMHHLHRRDRTGDRHHEGGAEGMRPVSLELGGKNAGHRVCRLRLRQGGRRHLPARLSNCGQVCLGTERVYVERPIFDKFVAALKARPKA
jgi:aminomuconate-semialdehyde/2-hydroxymuconate-6-semialdehyde dehydrogenase